MKGRTLLTFLLAFLSSALFILPVATATEGWTRIYQWEPMDALYPSSIVQASDGGFAIVGHCLARRVDNVGFPGHFTTFDELQFLKIDSRGEVQWRQAFTKIDDPTGQTGTVGIGQTAYEIVETADHGYIVVSKWYPSFCFKTDSQGKVLWSRVYSQSDEESWNGLLNSVIQTSDGGFALAGSVETLSGSNDFWLMKLDSKGDAQWNRTFNSGMYKGGSGDEYPRDDAALCLVQTRDGGYALAGTASLFRASTSSMVYPSWMVKTDSQGRMVWNQGYDAPNSQGAQYHIVQATDEGYVIAGSENQNIYLLRTDSRGQLQWGKQCGVNYTGEAKGLVQLNDGGLAVAGSWNNDFGLLRMDSLGNNMWTKTYNARENASTTLKSDDQAGCMVRTSDGAYAIVGSTRSEYESHQDIFLVKTETLEQPPDPSPSPTSMQTASPTSGQSSSPSSISPSPTQSASVSISPSPSGNSQSPSISSFPTATQTHPQQTYPAASNSPSTPTTSEPTSSPLMQVGTTDILHVAVVAAVIIAIIAAVLLVARRKRSKTP